MAKVDVAALQLEEKVISLNRVQKVHKGGRTLRWSALVVVGDSHGHVGVGLGKASEVPEAIRKGAEAAKKAIFTIAMAEHTIPHQVQEQVGAASVLLKPAAPGTGVIAGGAVRAIVEVAGIRDILTKSLGSANAVNIAWATVKSLKALRSPEEVASVRGKTVEEILGRMARGGEVA
jgi:small subunit ribosomal protein S5